MRPLPAGILVLTALIGLGGAAAGQSPAAPEPSAAPADLQRIVVTTPILGSVVRELVGERAIVSTLMDGGTDPHDWAPSAQDLESVYEADLVVANGLGLEEGLLGALDEARANGVVVFEATDHVSVRQAGEPGGEVPDPAADDASADHDHVNGDPHFWVDPLSMVTVVEALGGALAELGVDVADRQAALVAELTEVDATIRARLEAVPPEARLLVTGHDSMGYFADRYGFELLGSVIPGLASQGEVSARQLAELTERMRVAGVSVIFTEAGTPRSVAEALAGETGARVVELPSHTLPDGGTYVAFVTTLADAIIEGLS